VCACTPEGGINLGEWNGTLSKRWNKFKTYLQRYYNSYIKQLNKEIRAANKKYGTQQPTLALVKLQFFRAVEIQKRGALHEHVIFRVPASDFVINSRMIEEIREIAVECGYGHSIKLISLDPQDEQAKQNSARYLAKYVSKTAGQRKTLPYVPEEGKTSRYRIWTASSKWGATMKSIKQAQKDWFLKKVQSAEAVVEQGVLFDVTKDAPEDFEGGSEAPAVAPALVASGSLTREASTLDYNSINSTHFEDFLNKENGSKVLDLEKKELEMLIVRIKTWGPKPVE